MAVIRRLFSVAINVAASVEAKIFGVKVSVQSKRLKMVSSRRSQLSSGEAGQRENERIKLALLGTRALA
jgi:hypothetical protein